MSLLEVLGPLTRSTVALRSASVMTMPTARVVSLNRGRISDLVFGGKPDRSAIDKRPVAGPVDIGTLGLDGDEQGDKKHHGGADQALYAYARDDLDWRCQQLGRERTNDNVGESLTTAGINIS